MTGRTSMKHYRKKRKNKKRLKNKCQQPQQQNDSSTRNTRNDIDYNNITNKWQLPAMKMYYMNQVCHWKSKAIALQYENQILHSIIQNIYQQNENSDPDDSNSSEEDNEPVDEDMLAFMQVTAEHRLQRDQDKNMELEETEEKTLSAVPPPPGESFGSQRLQRIQHIFGESPNIIKLDTAALLRYQKAIDHTQPQYWPNIPLNIKW